MRRAFTSESAVGLYRRCRHSVRTFRKSAQSCQVLAALSATPVRLWMPSAKSYSRTRGKDTV
jgi:hypothetical protein